MIVEERDYTLKPGRTARFIEIYRDVGLPIQLQYLGTFHGHFVSEVGELNHVVAWWSYGSFHDREERRARMLADPRWPGYLEQVADLIHLQSNRILQPTPLSPLR